jgi:probable HAF family extracellular repeat protein
MSRRVSNGGSVIGQATLASGASHAFLWRDGRMVDLGPAGGSSLAETAIGRLVVGSASASGGFPHAALWRGDSMIDLGTLGHTTSAALDVNRHGSVIGMSTTPMGEVGNAEQRSFLWRDGHMADLATLLTNGAGWAFDAQLAVSINAHEWIVGSAVGPSGLRAVLLRPTNRPTIEADDDD